MKSLEVGQEVYTASFHTGIAHKLGTIRTIRDGVTVATDNGPVYDHNSNVEVELLDGSKRWFSRHEIFNHDHIVWVGFQIGE